MTVAGLAIAAAFFRALDPDVAIDVPVDDGARASRPAAC